VLGVSGFGVAEEVGYNKRMVVASRELIYDQPNYAELVITIRAFLAQESGVVRMAGEGPKEVGAAEPCGIGGAMGWFAGGGAGGGAQQIGALMAHVLGSQGCGRSANGQHVLRLFRVRPV
jgi:hypothetical protein